jgi:hypothetical protein
MAHVGLFLASFSMILNAVAVAKRLSDPSVGSISSDARKQESELLQNQIAHIGREIRSCDSSQKVAELSTASAAA